MSKSRIFYFCLFLSLLNLFACNQPDDAKLKPKKHDVASKTNKAVEVQVSLAPFDKYPDNAKYPLAFRFSEPVAPINKNDIQSFSKIKMSPEVDGVWSWQSDSELVFKPRQDWKADSIVDIDISDLNTGLQDATAFSNSKFKINLPSAIGNQTLCEYSVYNKTPLIQIPKAVFRFSYPIDNTNYSGYFKTYIRRDGKDQQVESDLTYLQNGMSIEVKGPQLFRPQSKSELIIIAKQGLKISDNKILQNDIECKLSYTQEAWDQKSIDLENVSNERPIVSLSVQAAPTLDSESSSNKGILKIGFKRTANSELVSHAKPKGIIIEKGINILPFIKGRWKTDEDNQALLNFVPDTDWPIGAKLKINVDKSQFPEIDIKNDSTETLAPALEGEVFEAKFTADPNDSENKRVYATLKFNFPVSTEVVKKNLDIKIRTEPEKNFNSSNVKNIAFEVTQDEKSKSTLYVKTDKISLSDEPGEAIVLLHQGIVAMRGGEPMQKESLMSVQIPSNKTVFRVDSLRFDFVKKPDEKTQRVMALEFTEDVDQNLLSGMLELYVLPDCSEKKNKKICKGNESFSDQGAVSDDAVKQSTKISLNRIERSSSDNPKLFLYSVDAPSNKEVFIRIRKDLKSKNNYSLFEDYRNVQFLEEFPKELSIMHQGSLLSLSGSRKLGIRVRNIEKIQYELSKIAKTDVHHMVSIAEGDFSKPNFYMYNFGLDQIAQRFTYLESFPEMENGETNYSTIDFNKFVSKDNVPKGLFILSVKEKLDEGESETYNECSEYDDNGNCLNQTSKTEDKRLVLLTDLGMIVKDGVGGEHEVFILSFKTGLPVSNAKVQLLGQNGISVYEANTDDNGHVQFPSTKDLEREKRPLLYTVEKGDDYSFLPYQKEDRRVNFSRFDISGVYNSDEAEGLRAMLFSDRGIYRPGDKANFGIIVRKRNLETVSKIPLEVSISDPRGIEILRQKIELSKYGFNDFSWSSLGALTGTYSISLELVKTDDQQKFLLGSTAFRVEEFQPDKLNVKATYVDNSSQEMNGWYQQSGKLSVTVANLFGLPAVENKVKGRLLVRPWDGALDKYKGYSFYLQDSNKKLPLEPEDLGEVLTNEQGKAEFIPNLSRFAERAFRIELASEAFEKDSGRSVIGSTKALVSNAKYFIGWKADGNLSYISKGAIRKVNFVSVDSKQDRISTNELRLELIQTKMVSALVKRPNGSFGYEMTPKREVVSSDNLSIDKNGLDFNLKTSEAGNYDLKILDKDGVELNSIQYQVHGEGDTTFMSDRSSEIGIALDKQTVEPDQELEISINAPYAGSGLLTIERDKVYASKWFNTDKLSSVQKIKVPRGIVGNAYVSVVFVRSADSKEIFSSPLSYGTKPFTIAKSEYTADISLLAPAKIKPGTNLEVSYQLSQAGKVLLYAVDEGILQFARYKNPEPVSAFVPKRALEIETFQILDLLLPDQKLVDEVSSPGGDEDVGLGKYKNPFSRKNKAPMVFWSGIINEGKTKGTISIPVPEYFNGTIRVIGVVANEKKLGATNLTAVSQNDYVIEAQAPYAVSPGDEFEVGATIGNAMLDSKSQSRIKVSIQPQKGLEMLGGNFVVLDIPPGQDKSFKLKMKASDEIGEKKYSIAVTNSQDTSIKPLISNESISIRPPQPLRTSIKGGISKDGQIKSIDGLRKLYPELRNVTASVSQSPLGIGRSLVRYLKEYPYGCTEQLVSKAFASVIFGADPDLDLNEEDLNKFVSSTFASLSSRQRYKGDFGLWDVQSESDLLFSVYAAHFLLEAVQKGLEVPKSTFDRSQEFIKSLSNSETYTQYEQLSQAYALYLRARNSEVVSTQAKRLLSQLDRQWGDSWRNTSIAHFLAATFQIMKMEEDASQLLKKPDSVWNISGDWPISNFQFHLLSYAYVSAKHFPENTWLSTTDIFEPVAKMVEDSDYSTFTASFAMLAFEAMSKRLSTEGNKHLSIANVIKGIDEQISLNGDKIKSALIPFDSEKINFKSTENKQFYYELSETGYDFSSPEPYSKEINITREIKNQSGMTGSDFLITDKIDVTLFIESTKDLSRIAVLEMIPGGMELDLDSDGLKDRLSINPGANTWMPNSIDVQEDRIIFFGNLKQGTNTFTYRMKPVAKGSYQFPASYAEAMYDLKIKHIGEKGKINVN